jgi:hypothetical protein
MDASISVATSESLDDHLAGPRQRFFPVVGKHGENPAQERVLSRTQMVEHIGESASGFAAQRTSRARSADALKRNTIVRHRHDFDGKPRARIRQLNCYDFSNYAR